MNLRKIAPYGMGLVFGLGLVLATFTMMPDQPKEEILQTRMMAVEDEDAWNFDPEPDSARYLLMNVKGPDIYSHTIARLIMDNELEEECDVETSLIEYWSERNIVVDGKIKWGKSQKKLSCHDSIHVLEFE